VRGKHLDESIAASLYRSLKRLREHGLIIRDPWGGYWSRDLLSREILEDWISYLNYQRIELVRKLRKLDNKIREYKELIS